MKLYEVIVTDTIESNSIYGIFDSYKKAKAVEKSFNSKSNNLLLTTQILEYQLNKIEQD